MLTLRHITKSFGDQKVLEGLDLQIGAGEMASVMGKSGTGKSTLLSVIAGLVKPDAGEVAFDGVDLAAMDEEALARFRLKHVGFIFQDFKLIPSLSAYDNILLGVFPRKDLDGEEKHRRIVELGGQVGLSGKLPETVDNLSGGEKQRVAIARSLVNRPTLVLADEPTGNLDAETAGDILDLFGELHRTLSTSFLIVTHDSDIAARTGKKYHLEAGGLMS